MTPLVGAAHPGARIASWAAVGFFALVGPAHLLLAQDTRSQWAGVYTVEQAVRGQTVYDKWCASCHGTDLGGVERAPSLAGDEFAFNWDGATLGELFELMHFSMPQNDPGSLSVAQNADILAYMLRKGGYPPGEADLPTDLESLHTLRFVATRP